MGWGGGGETRRGAFKQYKKMLSESSQSEYSEPFPSLHASIKQNSKKQKRGDGPGPGRPKTNFSTSRRKPAGRLPLSKVTGRQDSSVTLQEDVIRVDHHLMEKKY